VVRTAAANPLALAATLRKEVAQARRGFRVRDTRTQEEFNQTDTVRERLLAILAAFFAGLATLLAGIGLYGVLDYSVLQRRREIGIRVAIGARPGQIVGRIAARTFALVFAGAAGGLVIGMAAARSIESLLYQVKLTDFAILALPAFTIQVTTLVAGVPAVIRALRIDPAAMLRID
jgi:ABC-type antimicrobial peptide transport system permease subunit